MKFKIISDSFEMVKGGIEKQAEILNYLLHTNGYDSELISFSEFRFREVTQEDILIIEGIHRSFLLKLLFHRNRNRIVLFTHGSFYLWSDEGRRFIKSSETPFPKLKRMFDILFMKNILVRINLIVTLSVRESVDISNLFSSKSLNFYDLGNFSDEPDSTKYDLPKDLETLKGRYICYIGRLEKRKNPVALVEAAIKLDTPVVFAGQDQGELIKLRNFCSKNNFNKLIYLGIVSKEMKFALIKYSNFIVIPSFFEGLPTVALEAIKIHKRVILTKYCYMNPHPCISFVDPSSEDILREIQALKGKSICATGYTNNTVILKNFLNIIETQFDNSR